ncbi:MAG TPA: hypothetical protein VN969_46735 [Streptosporangiaceae bacterium]|nr:hypothetical protein [Streptosporangiaceae bacterium]
MSVPSGVYSGSPVELEPCNSSNDHQLWAYLDGTFEYTPDPQRAGRIGPGGQRHHACCHRGRRAGRRAAGRQAG